MTKTNSKSHPVFAYLVDCIDEEITGTTPERLKEVLRRFKSEYCYPENLKRYGSIQNTFKNWLMGLPSAINVDFENYKILQLAVKWGGIPENATEKQQDKILENWFNFISVKFFQLCRFNKVDFVNL